jgi:hypothetical protein
MSSIIILILIEILPFSSVAAFAPRTLGGYPQQQIRQHQLQHRCPPQEHIRHLVGPRHIWPTYKKNIDDESSQSSSARSPTTSEDQSKSMTDPVQPVDNNTREDQEFYDVERFRNRAELMQSILKEKVQEVALLRNKVLVLQDVVGRLQTQSKGELEKQAKEQEGKYSEILMKLREEFNTTKRFLEEQAQQQAMVIQTLQDELDEQNLDSTEKVETEREENRKLGNQIKALRKEVLDMDQTLEFTQGELQKVQKQLAARETELLLLQDKENRKVVAIEAKLRRSETELQSALMNTTRTEALRQESVEIATAAVLAAEKREHELKSQMEGLQTTILLLQEEKQLLQSQLEQGLADSILKSKVIKLEKKLLEEKLSNDIKRKVENEQYEKELHAERKKYEEEIERLRTQVSQPGHALSVGVIARVRRLWKKVRL